MPSLVTLTVSAPSGIGNDDFRLARMARFKQPATRTELGSALSADTQDIPPDRPLGRLLMVDESRCDDER